MLNVVFGECVLAILAPGQGSQTPGMLTPWLEHEAADQRVRGWSDRVGLDLVRLGTQATATEIQDTAIAQPLIVAASLLAWEELRRVLDFPAETLVAGHSVGELTAAAIAGVCAAEDAISLAAARGTEMAKACAVAPTSMAAVMLGDPQLVVAWLTTQGLTAANYNGAGQIVASGDARAIAHIVAHPLEGTKVRELKVAGAFHSPYMSAAQDALRDYVPEIPVADPVYPLLSNADGQVIASGKDYLNRIVGQVTRPVRWDLTMNQLAKLGVSATVELPPAGTLTGLVKRQLKASVVSTFALKTPNDLVNLRECGTNS